MKTGSPKSPLPTLDDLFSSQAERDDAKLERLREIPLCELHPFKDHPFKIMKDEEMDRMIESTAKRVADFHRQVTAPFGQTKKKAPMS